MIKIEFEEDGTKGKFVIYENDLYAGEMTFSWAGTEMFIVDHTGVDSIHSGKGFGRKLFFKVVEYAREKGVKVLPLCPFVKAEFDKNPDAADVLHSI